MQFLSLEVITHKILLPSSKMTNGDGCPIWERGDGCMDQSHLKVKQWLLVENTVGFIILGEFQSFWLYLNIFFQYVYGGLGARVREKRRQHIPISFKRRIYLRFRTLYCWRRFLQKVISDLNFLYALFSISLFCFQMHCLQSINFSLQ